MKKYMIFVAVTCLLFACSEGEQKSENFTKNVKITTAKKVEEVSTLSFSGMIQGAHEINVGFKTAGQIENIYAKQGDYVNKGQLLAQLDPSDYKLALEAYQINYNQLKVEVARLNTLYEAKTISANDYEKARAQLEQLEVQVKTYQKKVEYTKLYAPTSGYIHAVFNDPSEMIDAGSPLFNLLDNSKYEVVVDIPANQYVERLQFRNYYITSPYFANKKMPLNLVSISPKADVNQLYQMRFIINGNNNGITAGMNVELLIEKENTAYSGKYTITPHAVFSKDEKTYVWIYSEGKVKSKEVIIDGIDKRGNLYITGIDDHVQIVNAGVNALHEGESVNVLKDSSKTNIGGLL